MDSQVRTYHMQSAAGDPEAEARVIVSRMREGTLSLERVRLAAWSDSARCKAIFGDSLLMEVVVPPGELVSSEASLPGWTRGLLTLADKVPDRLKKQEDSQHQASCYSIDGEKKCKRPHWQPWTGELALRVGIAVAWAAAEHLWGAKHLQHLPGFCTWDGKAWHRCPVDRRVVRAIKAAERYADSGLLVDRKAWVRVVGEAQEWLPPWTPTPIHRTRLDLTKWLLFKLSVSAQALGEKCCTDPTGGVSSSCTGRCVAGKIPDTKQVREAASSAAIKWALKG